jgi:hypothetical protein
VQVAVLALLQVVLVVAVVLQSQQWNFHHQKHIA